MEKSDEIVLLVLGKFIGNLKNMEEWNQPL
jgi:hypothetical protein